MCVVQSQIEQNMNKRKYVGIIFLEFHRFYKRVVKKWKCLLLKYKQYPLKCT